MPNGNPTETARTPGFGNGLQLAEMGRSMLRPYKVKVQVKVQVDGNGTPKARSMLRHYKT